MVFIFFQSDVTFASAPCEHILTHVCFRELTDISICGHYKPKLWSSFQIIRNHSHQTVAKSKAICHVYRPQWSCGQGNVFTDVCLSTGGEGVCLSACWDAIPPNQADPPPGTRQTAPQDQADTPPDQADTPPGPGRHPPRSGRHPLPPGSRLWHTVYEWLVRILLECILVFFDVCYRGFSFI